MTDSQRGDYRIPFHVGQQVYMRGFVDSVGKTHSDTPVLTVKQIRLITSYTMDPYYRVLAYGPGLSSYEGAACMFCAITKEE